MTLIEAMAAAKPVIANPVGVVPRLVNPGQTGLLVDPGDASALSTAILRVLSDVKFREKLGANAQCWVTQNFSAAAMARKYSEECTRLKAIGNDDV